MNNLKKLTKKNMQTQQQTKIIIPAKILELHQSLPKSWLKAAGILRGKKAAMEKHLKKIRLEWAKRVAKLA